MIAKNLHQLPTCILYNIINYLDVSSKLSLSQVCKRLKLVINDSNSWVNAHFLNCRISLKSKYSYKIKSIIGNHTREIKLVFSSPHKKYDSWKKLSDEIDFLMSLCENIKKVTLIHIITTIGHLGANDVMSMQLSSWPKSIEYLHIKSLPKMIGLKCLGMCSQKVFSNLKFLSIENCSWFCQEELQFLAPNKYLIRLELYDCFRLLSQKIDDFSRTTPTFLRFKNLTHIKIQMNNIPKTVFSQLTCSYTTHVTLFITNTSASDYSKEIFQFIKDRNDFYSSNPPIYQLNISPPNMISTLTDYMVKDCVLTLTIPFSLYVYTRIPDSNDNTKYSRRVICERSTFNIIHIKNNNSIKRSSSTCIDNLFIDL